MAGQAEPAEEGRREGQQLSLFDGTCPSLENTVLRLVAVIRWRPGGPGP